MNKKIVVCTLDTYRSPFLDNKHGKCTRCKRGVQYRPYISAKIPKVCIECFDTYYDPEKVKMTITDEAKAEIKRVLKLN